MGYVRDVVSRVDGTATGGPVVVTIDGAAGAGKSSTAKEVARRLGFRHLDSGALYRGVTFALLADVDGPDEARPDWGTVTREQIDALGVHAHWGPRGMEVWAAGRRLPDEALRGEAVTAAVSAVSALPPVREWLMGVQRNAVEAPGLVADGRDMGTVVFPDADLKVFLKADEVVRARRRLIQKGHEHPTAEQVRREASRIADRDARDSDRAISPLQIPERAVVIDTTALDFDEQVSEIVSRTPPAGGSPLPDSADG
ncbi:MAG: (d)CMP kinase [Longimicrobiales bacterium]